MIAAASSPGPRRDGSFPAIIYITVELLLACKAPFAIPASLSLAPRRRSTEILAADPRSLAVLRADWKENPDVAPDLRRGNSCRPVPGRHGAVPRVQPRPQRAYPGA